MTPDILYKYLSFPGGLKTLLGTSLRYRHPNEFNDPFEFMPGGYTGDTLQERQRRVYELLCTNPKYRESYNQIYNSSFSEDEWNRMIINRDSKVADFISDDFVNSIFDNLQRRDWTIFREKASKDIVFCSFSQRPDNILMWSHYAGEHRGIVIGFSSSYFDRLHKVKYEKKRALIPLSSTVNDDDFKLAAENVMTTKSLQWSYEEEWRQIIPYEEVYNEESLLLKKFPPEAVLIVIFGCQMSCEEKDEIKSVLADFSNSPEIKQAILNQRNFALDLI